MIRDFKAVIFDLDGTLLYTLDDLIDSLNEVLREEGLPLPSPDDYRLMVGNGLEMLVVRALPAGLRVPAHVKPILKKFSDRYQERQTATSRPYDGIRELLGQLADRGLDLAVLSNKAHPNAVAVVEHFFPGQFRRIWGLRSEVPAKPHPDGALLIAEEFGLDPGQCLYVGDSNVDMETAQAAAMYGVGAAWGYRSSGELAAAGALEIINSPLELLGLIHD